MTDEGLAREGVDGDAHVLTGGERRHVALGDVAAELERVVLHQPEDHRARLHVGAGVEQAGGDGAFERRTDGGALELDAELVAPRPRHLERRPHLLVFLGRDDAVAPQRTASPLVGDGLLEARLGLAQLRPDIVLAHARQHLLGVHAIAEVGLDGDEPALDLARHLGLRGGRERADHRHRALDGPHGRVRDGDRHGLRLGGRRLGPRALAASGDREAQRGDQDGGPSRHPAALRRRAAGSCARSRPWR